MAKLDVSGSFLITIGRGNGPETWVVLSVNDQDGAPVNPHESQIEVFVAMSAMFGSFAISLHISDFQNPSSPMGFCNFRVTLPSGLGSTTLHSAGISTLGVVVTTKTDRGQALICDCGKAEISSWLPDRVREQRD
nr:hypothetical protein [uncultured bacterium]